MTATMNLLLGFHDDLASHSTSVAVIVSSRAGYQPMPNMAVYAACKAFSQSLAQALFCEWEKEGIQVQSLMPGAVDTELEANQNLLREGILRKADMQNPNEVVEASIQGLINKSPRVFTGKGAWLQRICAALLPVTTLLRAIHKQFATKSPKRMISEVSSETNQVKRIQKGELYAHHVRK
ncbi:MAG: SDR family NAD(P)-dependent oxidoreductase [Elusimicrobia bacterium]|nr:SDR family NAD(P)-dependent oxidoreductase [Elusimicrobiota bacterium]